MIRESVTFRPKSEEPQEPGWYYGREKDRPNKNPFPIYVILHPTRPFLVTENHVVRSAFDWFGPVAEIREATALTTGDIINSKSWRVSGYGNWDRSIDQ